jgi:hypothetical protein
VTRCTGLSVRAWRELIKLKDIRSLPLGERKAKLAKLLVRSSARIVFNEHNDENGATVFEHACRFGFECIVSKRLTAPYRQGRHGIGSRSRTRIARRRGGCERAAQMKRRAACVEPRASSR